MLKVANKIANIDVLKNQPPRIEPVKQPAKAIDTTNKEGGTRRHDQPPNAMPTMAWPKNGNTTMAMNEVIMGKKNQPRRL